MTIVYAVSQQEYIVSQMKGLVNFFPGVTVDLKKVAADFQNAQQLILFLDETKAKNFAQSNSNTLSGKTVLSSSQRAILTMEIDDEFLKERIMTPVERNIRSDVRFKANPVVLNTADAYVIERKELLVQPTLLKLSIGTQLQDFTETPLCRIL